jgi:hypothetical protein
MIIFRRNETLFVALRLGNFLILIHQIHRNKEKKRGSKRVEEQWENYVI